MSKRTIYSCDNTFDAESNVNGFAHYGYSPNRKQESEDPVRDGWHFGVVLNGGDITIGLIDNGILETKAMKGLTLQEKIFCSILCCMDWATRTLKEQEAARAELSVQSEVDKSA